LASLDVYAYGMTVLSTIHLLDGPYPERDSYQEILRTFVFPGGEAANAAILLARWGLRVKLSGPHLGHETRGPLLDYFRAAGIDTSGMQDDPEFAGLRDWVLADQTSRTVFGTFRHFLSAGPIRWSPPDPDAIRSAAIVLLDPFFGEETRQVAEVCGQAGKPYVIIDCAPDSLEHQQAAGTVVSGEFLREAFGGEAPELVLRRYQACSPGLVVFTSGPRTILYGRRGDRVKRFRPYQVRVKGTLGAGDSFRAGVLYGLLKAWDDETTVRFAAAAAAIWCARFPGAAAPPSLEDVLGLAARG
jgi:sugar/nucleoside kinase (ribokinase family)